MKFIKVKVCHIPGFFSDNIGVYAEETVPDEVVKGYALSQVYGGNYKEDKMSFSVVKMKEKTFQKYKTDIPERFYKDTGFSK